MIIKNKDLEDLAVKLPSFIEKIKKIIKGEESQKPLSVKEKWMLFLLFGVLLAVIVFPAGKKENEKNSVGSTVGISTGIDTSSLNSEMLTLKQYEDCLSRELEAILSQMDGTGAVQAWVTLNSSSEKILYQEKDSDITNLQEADSVGGTRSEVSEKIQQAVLLDKNGNPYIVKTLQPEVEGVLVVAEGAGDSVIKKNITEAVQVLFGIDAHRIKVAKKKVEE